MRNITLLLLVLCLIFSCAQTEDKSKSKLIPASCGKFYGGVFKISETEYIKTLFPLAITDVYSYRVACQIYEGLFKFDQADISKLNKCLIDTYTVSQDAKVYRFTLKKGIYFHNSPCFESGVGREVKSSDIQYCFEKICTPSSQNNSFTLFEGIVKGANQFYNAAKDGSQNLNLEGFKIIDDYTFEVELEAPNSMFLFNLARPGAMIYPKELVEKFPDELRANAVGTGPFSLGNIQDEVAISLKKNPRYHGKDECGNQLPFFDGISIKFIREKKIELSEFQNGNLDMVYRLPTEDLISITESALVDSSFYLQRVPEMSTQFLTFQTQGKIFSNVNLRKAFNFAIDRDLILNAILQGEGEDIGRFGFVPPVFNNYPTRQIKGYTYNRDSAVHYFRKAGYGPKNPLPPIDFDLNSEGERYTAVANELRKQLKENLQVELRINLYPSAQIIDKAFSGKYDLLRISWVADYPSPQNYLWMCYGKDVPKEPEERSFPNIPRYKSKSFDTYYEKAMTSATVDEAMENFFKAEQIMIQDAPILVLWYDESYRIVRSNIKSFPSNPIQFRDYSAVYMINKKS
jgi:peptide/nickel transport system substrate-binding protein